MPLPVYPNVPVITQQSLMMPMSHQVSGALLLSNRGTPSCQVNSGSVVAPVIGHQCSGHGPVSRTFATPYPPSVQGSVPPTEHTLVGKSPPAPSVPGSRQATLNANDILTQTWAMSLDAPMQSGELEAEEGEAMDESPSVGHVTCTYVGGVSKKSTVRAKDVPSLGSELQASLCEVCVDRGSV